MAENLTVARPYAEAAFSVAIEENKLNEWQNMLFAMADACLNKEFMSHLKMSQNSKIASDSLISLLKDLINDEGINLIRTIGDNNRFEVIPEIYGEFLRLRAKHDKLLSAELISARPLSKEQISVLKKKLAEKYNAVVSIENRLDPSLIGGAVLKIGDKVIDASFKSSLEKLSSTLN